MGERKEELAVPSQAGPGGWAGGERWEGAMGKMQRASEEREVVRILISLQSYQINEPAAGQTVLCSSRTRCIREEGGGGAGEESGKEVGVGVRRGGGWGRVMKVRKTGARGADTHETVWDASRIPRWNLGTQPYATTTRKAGLL